MYISIPSPCDICVGATATGEDDGVPIRDSTRSTSIPVVFQCKVDSTWEIGNNTQTYFPI